MILQTVQGELGSLGRDVLLQTVQGGKWWVRRDVMLQSVQGERFVVESRDVTDIARGNGSFG